jgi:hypothetical protein
VDIAVECSLGQLTSKTGGRIVQKAPSEFTEAVFDKFDPAKIIEAGSKSPLGLTALVIVILAFVALAYFKAENKWVKLPIFFALLGALGSFAIVGLYKSALPTSPVSARSTIRFYPNTKYRIIPFEKDGKALDVKDYSKDNHGQIQLWEWRHGANQKWYITERPGGTYAVQSFWSKLVLDLDVGTDPQDNGNRIQQYKDGGTPNQRWQIKSVNPETPDSPCMIVNSVSQMALEAAATTDGAVVQQGEWHAAPNQEWYITPVD